MRECKENENILMEEAARVLNLRAQFEATNSLLKSCRTPGGAAETGDDRSGE